MTRPCARSPALETSSSFSPPLLSFLLINLNTTLLTNGSEGRRRRGRGLLQRRGHLAGDHRVGAPEERLLVARQDPGPRRAAAVADHVPKVRHAGQASRPRGRQR